MEIVASDFALFEQPEFSFKKLKTEKSTSEITALKTNYQTHWQKWKHLNQMVTLPSAFAVPKVESWTNGWNLRNHFWCAYRSSLRQQEATCLATLLNQKQFQIYLMYQHYKSDARYKTKSEYNQVLEQVPRWAERHEIGSFYIWDNAEPELHTHLPLAEYLADPAYQNAFRAHLEATDSTFQLGALFYAPGPIVSVTEKIAGYLQALAELYDAI